MKVRDFIEWLKTQEQDATVEVISHKNGRGYYEQGGTAYNVEFDPEKHVDICDLRGNSQITPDKSYYNSVTILIGEYNG
jgi:hypothetical protein